jgi:hypothetical protein
MDEERRQRAAIREESAVYDAAATQPGSRRGGPRAARAIGLGIWRSARMSIRDGRTPVEAEGGGFAGGLRDALRSGDVAAALVLLQRCVLAVPARRQALVAWLPCVIECARLRREGRDGAALAVVERFIRQRIHGDLAALPRDGAMWLVRPARPEDVTACHVAAHACATRGIVARPWPWAERPPSGRVVAIGDDPSAAIGVSPDHRRHTLSDLVAWPRSVLARLAAAVG